MVFLPSLQSERPVASGVATLSNCRKNWIGCCSQTMPRRPCSFPTILKLLQSRGDTSPYLKVPDGKPSLNLLKMAREGLGFELRNAVAAVKQQKAPYRKDGIQIKSGDRTRNIRYRGYSSEVGFRQ